MAHLRKPHFGLLLLALIYIAYVSLGLPDGILGTAWPQVRADFGAPLNANWPIYILGMAGGIISGLSAGALMRRLQTGTILIGTTVLTALSMAACGASPGLWAIIAIAFLLGLGNGAVDAALNHHAATHLSSRHMNWLHGFWGVGVSMGTLIVSGVYALGGTWRSSCMAVAGVQAALAILFISTRQSWTAPGENDSEKQAVGGKSDSPASDTSTNAQAASNEPLVPVSGRQTLRLPAAQASMVCFFLYCGVEFGTGVWTTSLLQEGRGWHADAAALAVTLFWGSLTAGRFMAGTVSNKLGPTRMLRIALSGVLSGTALIGLSSLVGTAGGLAGVLTLAGLLLTGLSLAPIYPTLMHDTPACVGRAHAVNLIGFQAAAANVGLTILPGLFGTLMRMSSVQWLGLVLFLPALGLFLMLRVRARLGYARCFAS